MTTIDMPAFKRYHGIPDSTRNRAAVNTVIRKMMPGGAAVLEVIARLAQMQHGRSKPDAALQDMLDKLMVAREIMAEALFRGFLASQSAPEKNRGGPPLAEKRVDYSAVDWSKANAVIARELGVSRQNVAQQRKRHSIPQP